MIVRVGKSAMDLISARQRLDDPGKFKERVKVGAEAVRLSSNSKRSRKVPFGVSQQGTS